MSLVKLTDAVADGAMCLDGSPIAYYIRQNTSSTQWVIFFQGGVISTSSSSSSSLLSSSSSSPPAPSSSPSSSSSSGGWCYNLEDCYARAQTVLGSSTTYGPTYSSGGVFSGNQAENPYFYTWNAVHLQCLSLRNQYRRDDS